MCTTSVNNASRSYTVIRNLNSYYTILEKILCPVRSTNYFILDFIKKMGCCWGSCKEDSSSQNGDANERTHLLVDPVSNNTPIQRVHSDDFIARYPNSLPKKTDEQTALNRILQETATNVIDVAALDSHNLEQHEYKERMKQYQHRLLQGTSQRWQHSIPCLLIDIPSPEKVLGSTPLSYSDMMLVTTTIQNADVALQELKVEHKEDLVVPFRIP